MRLLLLSLLLSLVSGVCAAATCTAGRADGYECERVDLVGRLDLSALGAGNLNDVWGWEDPVTGVEYALVGAVDGTVFVDLGVPTAPRVVGVLPSHDVLVRGAAAPARCKSGRPEPVPRVMSDGGHDEGEGACTEGSAWRDLKVHADHVYIVSEAAGHGLQVFDLRRLRDFPPGSAPQTFAETAHYGGFGNAHNLVINEATGFAYAVGSDTYAGGPHFIDLSVPAAPAGAGGWADDGYTHDAQCVVYAGPDAAHAGREVCLLANEDTLTIIDVTAKDAVRQLSRTGYALSAYTHQVWMTADQRHAFANDELDELDFDLRTRTTVWDISDLDAPQLVREYSHPAATIDHNNYVHQGFVYQSNYTAGLVVLDGRDPLNLFEVGFFDTAPADDLRRFDGTWSNYPFFASGLVAVSDITGGLFVLRPRLPDASSADLGVVLETAGSGALRLAVTNAGATTAQAVHVVVASDPAVAIDSVSGGAPAVCEASPDAQITGQRGWHCRLASLAAGARVEFEIRFGTPLAAANLDAMVSSAASDPAPANNRARLQLTPASGGSGGGGGGGGGGGAGLGLLGALAALALRRRRA